MNAILTALAAINVGWQSRNATKAAQIELPGPGPEEEMNLDGANCLRNASAFFAQIDLILGAAEPQKPHRLIRRAPSRSSSSVTVIFCAIQAPCGCAEVPGYQR